MSRVPHTKSASTLYGGSIMRPHLSHSTHPSHTLTHIFSKTSFFGCEQKTQKTQKAVKEINERDRAQRRRGDERACMNETEQVRVMFGLAGVYTHKLQPMYWYDRWEVVILKLVQMRSSLMFFILQLMFSNGLPCNKSWKVSWWLCGNWNKSNRIPADC